MKGLEQQTTRRRETALLELFDYTRQIRDELDLETRALAGHAHREHVRHSDTENSEGSGEEYWVRVRLSYELEPHELVGRLQLSVN